MKILIAGGSGFIGSALAALLKKNAQVTVLGRNLPCAEGSLNWQYFDSVDGYDVIINLAGASVGEKRWSDKRKEMILSSRIGTTLKLAELCAIAKHPKPRLLNASAIGIYGLHQAGSDGLLPTFDDNSVVNLASSADFLAKVATAWEQATSPAVKAGCEVTWLRFGVVLGTQGGALKQLLPTFKMGLGGKIGSGKQIFPWISLHDTVRAIQFIIEKQITGPVCLVAPQVITQRQFAEALAKALHRPCFFPMPSRLIRVLFGEMGEQLLLSGQHVKPSRLQQLGFNFHAPTIEEALQQMLRGCDPETACK